MAKELNGSELADFIKERQARAVLNLKAKGISPKLIIINTTDNPASKLYTKLKQSYGEDINVDVELLQSDESTLESEIERLNSDDLSHGIIVQLPLEDMTNIESIMNKISPKKDVDGLNPKSNFAPATPTAILWLLAGYNVNLQDKKTLIVGQGRLVGAPLAKMLEAKQVMFLVADENTDNIQNLIADAEVIISAVGQPNTIKSQDVSRGSVVVDAGVSVEDGVQLGDVDPKLYDREDISITPQKGGVGPLTICALFENLIVAAGKSKDEP